MAEKLINITAPQYRCEISASCPAVYTDRTSERYRCPMGDCPAVLDDDSGNFILIGEKLDPVPQELAGKVGPTEAAVKLSADLLLSSLGIAELVEAANSFIGEIEDTPLASCREIEGLTSFRTLRNIVDRISSIKGGKSHG